MTMIIIKIRTITEIRTDIGMMGMAKQNGNLPRVNRSQSTSVSKVVKDPSVTPPDERTGLAGVLDNVDDIMRRRVTNERVHSRGSRKNLVIAGLGAALLLIIVGRMTDS